MTCIGRREEPGRDQAYLPQSAVEDLDDDIVGWLSTPREVEPTLLEIGPMVEQPPGELRAIVDPDAPRACPGYGQGDVEQDLNAMWRVRGFQIYADYVPSDEFADSIRKLLRLGREKRLALTCSEAVRWRCHRRIITNCLLLNDHPADDLMIPGHRVPATPTPGATATQDGKVPYPPAPT